QASLEIEVGPKPEPGRGVGAARLGDAVTEHGSYPAAPALPCQASGGVSVSSVASGRQANRTGAYRDVPSPAETCSHDGSWPGVRWVCRPLARLRSRSQFVTSAP